MTIGQVVKMMLTKLDWYGTLFPRIPVPIQVSNFLSASFAQKQSIIARTICLLVVTHNSFVVRTDILSFFFRLGLCCRKRSNKSFVIGQKRSMKGSAQTGFLLGDFFQLCLKYVFITFAI